MNYYGYMGRYARINLTKRKVKIEKTPKTIIKGFLGGTGFCAKILYDEISREIDPLSPENKLIVATGPVTGSGFPPSGRYMLASKSPLTGIWGESHAGGFFGPEIKFCGFDYLIIEGRAEKPVYLLLTDLNIEILDAKDLWGKNTLETTSIIRETHGDEFKVACIGQAGENLVRFACVINDLYRAAGRTGMGAVMGSKRLKAIAAHGTMPVTPYNPDLFQEFVKEAIYMSTEGKWGKAAAESLGKYGTPNLVSAINEIGRFPTKNHYTGVFDRADKIGPEVIRSKYRVKREACYGCVIACKYISQIKTGKYAGTYTGGPEYETIFAFGSNCLNDNIESIIHANMLCNHYGLDTISTGKVISWAMECHEHGLLDGWEDGLDLSWGNEDTIITLIHRIASREGLGKLLSLGVKRASEVVGNGTERFAMHVKGMEISGQDGRAHKSIGLTHAISVRGADHLRSLCTVDELGYIEIAEERFGKERAPEICNLLTEKYKGIIVKDQEDFFAIVDSLITCKYGTMWPPIFYFDFYAKLLPPLTGIQEFSTVKQLRLIAERIVTLKRLFNIREGLTRKDDTLPQRFLEEKMPDGPAKGQTVNLKQMLDEYYKERNWDLETGLPTEKELERLGLAPTTFK